MDKPENPSAFPCVGYGVMGDSYCQEGMTLRDYFAGQALASIPLRNWDSDHKSGDEVIQQWVTCAYHTADAMLAERSKP